MKRTVFPSLTRFSLRRTKGPLRLLGLLTIFVCLLRTHAQTDWPDVGHDPQALRYSPLKQIDVHNVARLAPAWTFRLKDEDNANGSRTIHSVELSLSRPRPVIDAQRGLLAR